MIMSKASVSRRQLSEVESKRLKCYCLVLSIGLPACPGQLRVRRRSQEYLASCRCLDGEFDWYPSDSGIPTTMLCLPSASPKKPVMHLSWPWEEVTLGVDILSLNGLLDISNCCCSSSRLTALLLPPPDWQTDIWNHFFGIPHLLYFLWTRDCGVQFSFPLMSTGPSHSVHFIPF